MRNAADQRVAHHTAAHGGEQRGDGHAHHVQPFFITDKVAGKGKSGGADDVDKVGGGHGGVFFASVKSGGLYPNVVRPYCSK